MAAGFPRQLRAYGGRRAQRAPRKGCRDGFASPAASRERELRLVESFAAAALQGAGLDCPVLCCWIGNHLILSPYFTDFLDTSIFQGYQKEKRDNKELKTSLKK
ncbi:uncharacterized protein RBU33_025073 [Hipposideros larvatus]